MINLGNIEIADLRLGATQVKAAYLGNWPIWNGEAPIPVADWLCFTAVDAGATICLIRSGSIDASFMTSTDGKTWTDYTFWTTITLENVGDKVYFRAKDENTAAFYGGYRAYLQFQITAGKRIAASGNIMTLLKADGSKTDITNEKQFRGLFQNCTSLTTAPELPATTVKSQCYYNMFEGCTSLSYIKVGFTDWRISGILSFTDNWLNNVAATGTFVCPVTLDTSTRGPSNVPEGWTVVQPLTFMAQQNNSTIRLDKCAMPGVSGAPPDISLEYSTDGITWTDYTWSGWEGATLTLATFYDKVYIRAKNENSTLVDGNSHWHQFVMTGQFTASGNIQSLLKADCSRTDVPMYCYTNLFKDCTSLKTAPSLPATTLNSGCYWSMFEGCTSLTKAPLLQTTELANSCYYSMFKGCTSLTKAPALPATTLFSSSYGSMFYSCTSLTAAPVISATTLADSCCIAMFRDCTSLTTAPVLPATTLTGSCYMSMFRDCTALTAAPVLSAETLANYCYSYMFQNCTSLSSVEVSFSSWKSGATDSWLNGVAASGTFTCPAELPDTRGVNNIPEGWTKTDAA